MQTNLADFIKNTPDGDTAEAILRRCVHCGFCNATCPTYQLLGDERDGPRGRIYLMKQVLEGGPVTASTQQHLDRCLTCRNCESTCPSGVEYGRLLDIGRQAVEARVARPLMERIKRRVLAEALPRRWIFTPAYRAGQLVRPLLSKDLQDKLRPMPAAGALPGVPRRGHARRMLLLEGCVQPAMAPNINAAAARVFDAVGVQLIRAPKAGCCGALRHHLNQHEAALDDMRRNIDAWWPLVEGETIDAIVMTASGCGATVKDYGHLLAHDAAYAAKAARIALLTRDLSEVLPAFEAALLPLLKKPAASSQRLTYHPPCTLQHGQQVRGKVESLMRAAGFEVRLCADSHLCCGSAGTYSMLQPALARQLRDDKLDKLAATRPDVIVSANIGCISHLQSGSETPVRHWIELLDAML